jgi:hypothetical protein
MPVSLKNGQSHEGNPSERSPIWRPAAPVSIKPNLRSRNKVDIGEKTVSDNIARAFYSRLPGITNYSFVIKRLPVFSQE